MRCVPRKHILGVNIPRVEMAMLLMSWRADFADDAWPAVQRLVNRIQEHIVRSSASDGQRGVLLKFDRKYEQKTIAVLNHKGERLPANFFLIKKPRKGDADKIDTYYVSPTGLYINGGGKLLNLMRNDDRPPAERESQEAISQWQAYCQTSRDHLEEPTEVQEVATTSAAAADRAGGGKKEPQTGAGMTGGGAGGSNKKPTAAATAARTIRGGRAGKRVSTVATGGGSSSKKSKKAASGAGVLPEPLQSAVAILSGIRPLVSKKVWTDAVNKLSAL